MKYWSFVDKEKLPLRHLHDCRPKLSSLGLGRKVWYDRENLTRRVGQNKRSTVMGGWNEEGRKNGRDGYGGRGEGVMEVGIGS